MNWLTNLLRQADEKNQLLDDLKALAALAVFAVGVMALLWWNE